MKKILGISAFYHDSAAALVIGGKIIAAAQEERFTRKKHTPDFPAQAIRYCLEEGGLRLNDLDALVFYDKPFLKFERLLQTYYAFAPRGLVSFIKAMPVWLSEKLFLKKLIYDQLKELGDLDKKKLKLLFPEHHLSHAASAFFATNHKTAAILTIDGVGEWCTASISVGEENNIRVLKEMNFPHSVGLLYSAFTYFLGFTVNSGEYKLMGLAPYGNLDSEETQSYIRIIKEHLVSIKADGSVWLNQRYFNYATGLKMIHEKLWEQLFGLKKRQAESELTQPYCNLAQAIQMVTEEIVLAMAHHAKELSGAENLCMAGGVALNCVANGKLIKEGIFKSVYIQPAAGDAGGALGAALAASYMYYNEARPQSTAYDNMQGSYLGPSFSEKEVLMLNKRHQAVFTAYADFARLCDSVAALLAEGKVVGWFQGRMEFGPRALGNRSILADARNAEMQKKLNLKIKYREGFRPFAPSVLAENCADYFDLAESSPYMLLVAAVKPNRRKPLPENYAGLGLWEKLYLQRSDIPAVTHLDYSARIQTVHRETNPHYYGLLKAFQNLTGYGVLVNTSFNVRGEPVVCTPEDAYRCFMNTEMDYLVINNFVYAKTGQPDWENKEKWKINYTPD